MINHKIYPLIKMAKSNPNPFDHLFDQIADMIALTQDKKSQAFTGKLDDDIEEQLDELENSVELFKEITERAIEKSGINRDTLQATIDNPPTSFSQGQKRIIERASKMQEELKKIESEFNRQRMIAKMQKKKSKSTGKKRKKKFKRLGGQGWMPL